ncbi:MAG: hypothetical protein DRJ05_13345, partial [Bacteroidetes bacterium]
MKRTYKISIYIVSAIIILLVVFNLLFSSILRWQIDNFSNGKVHLRSEKASANIFNGSILFTDVLVEFDSMSVDAASKIYLNNLKFSSLRINHIGIFQLLFKRDFKVGKIEFSDPELNFMRDTVISRQDLFTKVITPEVVKEKSLEATFSFDIGEIVINQGAMHFRGRQGEEVDLGKINIRIRDVRLSDLSQMDVTKKDLSAHFELNVNLYEIQKRFKDEYTFSIDSFSYYSNIKHLLVSGISLVPDSLDDFKGKPEIRFNTGFLNITGFELNEFILGKNLQFEKIQLSNGYFWESKDYYFLNNEDAPDTTMEKGHIGLSWLNVFHTDTLQLQGINILSLTKKGDTVYEVQNADLVISDINVDSNFIAELRYLDLSDRVSLNSSGFRVYWLKPAYDFQCDTFSYSGGNGRQFMENVRLTHYSSPKGKSGHDLLMDVRIDSLDLKGINIRKILKSDTIHLSVFAQNPKVEFFNRDSLPQKKGKRKKGKFPTIIFVDEFEINDGSFRFSSPISNVDASVDNLDLVFDTLKIDMKKRGETGFVDFGIFDLDCEQLMYRNSENPVFARVDHLSLNDQSLEIDGIRFNEGSGSGKPLILESDIFSINDFKVKNLITRKEFVCGEIMLQKPAVYINAKGTGKENKQAVSFSKKAVGEKIAGALKGKVNKIKIDRISFVDGFVGFQNKMDSLAFEASIEMDMGDIRFNPNDPFGDTAFYFPSYFQFNLSDPSFVSPKLSLGMDSFGYDISSGGLLVVNIVAEGPKETLSGPKYKIVVPQIKLNTPVWESDIDMPVSFSSIGIQSPSLFFEMDKKENPSPSGPKGKFVLPFIIKDSVEILAGDFNVRVNKDGDTLGFSTAYFDLKWFADPKGNLDNKFEDDLLASIDFKLKDFNLHSDKTNVSLDNLYFDKKNNIIELEGIKQLAWIPTKDGKQKKLKNSVSMPSLHLENPHLNGKPGKPLGLAISNVVGSQTEIEVFPSGKKHKTSPQFRIQDSTAVKFLEVFKYVRIDSSYFPNIHVRVNTDSSSMKPIDFKRISFHMNGLSLDSSLLDSNKTSYADDIFVHLHDREIISADSMYKLRTSYLTYYFSKDRIV